MKKKLIVFFIAFAMVLQFLPITSEAASKDAYLIKVNKGTNCVTVYQKDKKGKYSVPIKAFIASTGVDTPTGTFHTFGKNRWKPLMGDVWGQYTTDIVNGILFHSVFYMSQSKSDLSNSAYNVLGQTASHGCVRLTCKDAKWIYDNCALGTTVKIFNGTSKDDPLGKPKAYKVNNGWDPTDPDPKNPWKNCFLTVTANNTKVEAGTKKINWKNVFTVTDAAGNKVSSKYYKVSGKVDTNKAGKYKITVTTTDKKKQVKKKQITLKVVDHSSINFYGIDNTTIERCSKFDPLKGVSAKTTYGKKIKKSKIKVTGTIRNSAVGKYELTYTVTASNNKKKTKKRTITVVDTIAPVVTGIGNSSLVLNNSSEEEIIQAIKNDVLSKVIISDNGQTVTKSLKSKLKLDVKNNGDSTYSVTYSVQDSSGNVTTNTIIYTINFNTEPQTN